MEVWKIIFLSKWVISRFHINLPRDKLPFQLVQDFFYSQYDWRILLLGTVDAWQVDNPLVAVFVGEGGGGGVGIGIGCPYIQWSFLVPLIGGIGDI